MRAGSPGHMRAPAPEAPHTQHRADMRYRDPEAQRLVGNGSYCLGWVLGVIRDGPHAREPSATRVATLGTLAVAPFV